MATEALLKPARKQDRTTMALFFVAALVAVGGIGFAVGHLTAPTSSATSANNGRGGFGNGSFARPSLAPGQTFSAGNGRGGFGGSTSVSGTVSAINGSTLTLTLSNGSTVTVDLSGTTTYHSEAAASSTDVKAGSTVTIQIDTTALAGETPVPGASGSPSTRTITAKDVLITTP